jgi:hypothetical protein
MNEKTINLIKNAAYYRVGAPNKIAQFTRYIRFTREETSFIHKTISMLMHRLADKFGHDKIVDLFSEDEQEQIKDALKRLGRLQ